MITILIILVKRIDKVLIKSFELTKIALCIESTSTKGKRTDDLLCIILK